METTRDCWAGLWGAGEPTHLVERVPPHVAAGQRLVEGEHHRVVLGVGLVAALPDPALVVRQRVVEAPGSEDQQRLVKSGSERRSPVRLQRLGGS